MAGQKKQRFGEIILPGLIVAFALSVLVYVGGALLQTARLAHTPEPSSALGSAALGLILGIAGSLIARRNKKRG